MLVLKHHKVMTIIILASKWAATRSMPILLSIAVGVASVALPFALSLIHAGRDLNPMDRRGQIIYDAPTIPTWSWNLDESTWKTRVDATYRTVDTVLEGYENDWREYYEYYRDYLNLLPQWATDRVRSRKPTTALEHHVVVVYGWPVRSFANYASGIWANPMSYTYHRVPAPIGPAPILVNFLLWSVSTFIIVSIVRAMVIAYRLRTSHCPSCGYRLLDHQYRCPECGFGYAPKA